MLFKKNMRTVPKPVPIMAKSPYLNCVAMFIARMYNHCKYHLGNSPLRPDTRAFSSVAPLSFFKPCNSVDLTPFPQVFTTVRLKNRKGLKLKSLF